MHDFRKMNLPVEIIRLVIRMTTPVPAAFDTPFEASISEDVEAVINTVRESMKTKLALYLIYRSFHDIVSSFSTKLLHSKSSDGSKPWSACFVINAGQMRARVQRRYVAIGKSCAHATQSWEGQHTQRQIEWVNFECVQIRQNYFPSQRRRRPARICPCEAVLSEWFSIQSVFWST
ncbi:hypothetical protein PILCRDRAFT_88627 [Piloderma croceum F 1598]|uniref:Uncharacterized protein n=1 Tax=Piloderma croceum (strain F 1598) TaxID=765440 RepID=A0A0C3B8M8_PILCF|nr:hypothetical protein PILCRDRAFT_88627 [Piloderma croceum F 1598]